MSFVVDIDGYTVIILGQTFICHCEVFREGQVGARAYV